VGQAQGGRGGAGLVEHLRGHVDPDDPSPASDLVGRDERVETAARTDVDHALADRQRAQREGIADAGERFDRAVGLCTHDLEVVAQQRGELAAGVEVILAARVDRDVAVLRLDLSPQGFSVDQ
jgi:hypothetical protein